MGDVIDFDEYRQRRKRRDSERTGRKTPAGRGKGKQTQLPSLPKPSQPDDKPDDQPEE